MPVSPDALLGVLATFSLAAATALWKLATMLAEVRGQVRHNGGSSLKDAAVTGATEAIAAREAAVVARELAAKVASDLTEHRDNQAREAADMRKAVARVQHDVTNVRAGQEHLLGQQIALEVRVDVIAAEHARHDRAVGAALVESLDVVLAPKEDGA